jgi:hypothetical protein
MKTNKAHMLSGKELRSLQMVLLEMLLEFTGFAKKTA